MGVMGTFCQICAMPVNHHHYVSMDRANQGQSYIYRNKESWDRTEAPFPFDESHDWLKKAVTIVPSGEKRTVIRSPIEDGVVSDHSNEKVYVGDGIGDAIVFHQGCHEIAGSPTDFQRLMAIREHLDWAMVSRYHRQLFEIDQFCKMGNEWMLVDPQTREGARNLARIKSWLAGCEGRDNARRSSEREADIELLAAKDRWHTAWAIDAGGYETYLRYRTRLKRYDLSTHPDMIWLNSEFKPALYGLPETTLADIFEGFERQLQKQLAPTEAIYTCVMMIPGRAQFVIYAKDLQKSQKRIEELSLFSKLPAVSFDNETDPQWDILLKQLLGSQPYLK